MPLELERTKRQRISWRLWKKFRGGKSGEFGLKSVLFFCWSTSIVNIFDTVECEFEAIVPYLSIAISRRTALYSGKLNYSIIEVNNLFRNYLIEFGVSDAQT